MAQSKFILDVGKKIEQISGAEPTIVEKDTAPALDWIRDPALEWNKETKVSETKAIELRTAKQTQGENVVKLKQINPNFVVKDRSKILCRFPRCSSTTRRLQATHSSQKIKQDLFLCKTHRTHLKNNVTIRCSEENVTESLRREDLEGYTHLIGKLEKAFTFLTKSSTLNTTDSAVAEVFLNTRNFLIITKLLNPDENNTMISLPGYMAVLQEFLKQVTKEPEMIQKLIKALEDVMNSVNQVFGIMYKWVSLANPGAQFGSGLGLVVGFASAIRFALPWPMQIAGTAIGLVAGYLMGSRSYDWWKERCYMNEREELLRGYQKFHSESAQTVSCEESITVVLYCVSANRHGGIAYVAAQKQITLRSTTLH